MPNQTTALECEACQLRGGPTPTKCIEIERLRQENDFMRNTINFCSGSCCLPEDWPDRLAWWEAR